MRWQTTTQNLLKNYLNTFGLASYARLLLEPRDPELTLRLKITTRVRTGYKGDSLLSCPENVRHRTLKTGVGTVFRQYQLGISGYTGDSSRKWSLYPDSKRPVRAPSLESWWIVLISVSTLAPFLGI